MVSELSFSGVPFAILLHILWKDMFGGVEQKKKLEPLACVSGITVWSCYLANDYHFNFKALSTLRAGLVYDQNLPY